MQDIADQVYASKVAKMLLASYPNQPHDADTFHGQMTIALTGRPKGLLRTLVSPTGYLAEAEFLSIASVQKWLDKHTPEQPRLHPEHRLLLPEPEFKISDEERARRAEMIAKLKREFAKTAQALTLPTRLKSRQRADTAENRAELLETPLMQEGGE